MLDALFGPSSNWYDDSCKWVEADTRRYPAESSFKWGNIVVEESMKPDLQVHFTQQVTFDDALTYALITLMETNIIISWLLVLHENPYIEVVSSLSSLTISPLLPPVCKLLKMSLPAISRNLCMIYDLLR